MYRFITANGSVVRVFDSKTESAEGSKEPTIVLLHGYMEAIEVWESFIELLSPHLRIVAIDLPGHGFSQTTAKIHTMEYLATTVMESLTILGIDRCTLLGHSMGGYVALEALHGYHERILSVVLMHSTPNPDSQEKSAQRDREIDVILSEKGPLLSLAVGDRFARTGRSQFEEQIEELTEMALLADNEGMIALLRGMQQRKDHNETMQKSSLPQLMIFGCDDPLIPLEQAEEVANNHPQAEIIWLENSGHLGFLEEPERCLIAVLDFMKRNRIIVI